MSQCKHEWAPVKERISGVEYDCAICRARKLVSHKFFTEDRIREIVREEIRAMFFTCAKCGKVFEDICGIHEDKDRAVERIICAQCFVEERKP